MVTSKDILFTCSYLPEEIVTAAGFNPVRIVSRARPSDADSSIHPTTCPYIRSIYAAAARDDWAGGAGIAIVNSCDGIRRLYDALDAREGGPRAVFLDVPHKRDAAAVDLFAEWLKRFARQLEEVFGGSPVTPDALERAITEKNALRRKMDGVFALQADGRISGRDVFSLLIDAATGDGGVSERIDALVSSARRKGTAGAGGRIVVSANVLDRPYLVEMIEEAGGAVVALDSCIGRRHYEDPVAEGSPDPVRAVAERYLTRPPCSRMEGIGERIDWLTGLARDTRADGVILSTVKYCDAWLYDQPLLAERLQDAGMGVLALENDYEWSGTGQMRTRVEAFLETLGRGGKRCSR
jgi:benzoyl-CoA reductase/2-hydroxyglutaryl-CoA dehydratase subunit BcrC/BadD/HgdB